MMEFLSTFESNILLFFQESVRNEIFNPFVVFITRLGDAGFIWILLTLILLLIPKTRKVGCMSAVALLLSLLVNNVVLKNLVARTRPFDAIQTLMPLVQRPLDFSFPSGHTASSFAAAGVYFRNLPKRFGLPLLILAVLISVSRLYVGVHFPTDVLFGLVSGLLLSRAAERIVELISGIIKKKKAVEAVDE